MALSLILSIIAFIYFLYYAVLPVTPVKRPKRSIIIKPKSGDNKPTGESYIYRNVEYPNELITTPRKDMVSLDHDVRTLADLLDNANIRYGNSDALGQRITLKHDTKKNKRKR